jgi:hypothetical protein
MKTRQGFVSNSSSSSFIIHWSADTDDFGTGEDFTFAEFVNKVLFDWGADRSVVDEVVEKTKKLDDETYETTYWTCMTNSALDYGNAAMLHLFMLSVPEMGDNSGCYKLLGTKIEYD